MFDVHAVYRITQNANGRGAKRSREKVFLELSDAEAYRGSQYDQQPMEGGDRFEINTISILNHIDDGPEYAREQARQNALRKLSPLELEVLGLKVEE